MNEHAWPHLSKCSSLKMPFLGYYLYEEKSKTLILSFQRFWGSKNSVIWLNNNIFSSITWKFKTLFLKKLFLQKYYIIFIQIFRKTNISYPSFAHVRCVSGGKKCSFFGKFGVLRFLEKPVLRFVLLYYRWLQLMSFWINSDVAIAPTSYEFILYQTMSMPGHTQPAVVVLHAVFLGYYFSGAFNHVHS